MSRDNTMSRDKLGGLWFASAHTHLSNLMARKMLPSFPISPYGRSKGFIQGPLTDTSDCQGLCVTFVDEIQASEPRGDSRELCLLLSSVDRPCQGTEPLGTVLGSSWEAGSHSPLSVPYCVLMHSLPWPHLPLPTSLCPYGLTPTHLTNAGTADFQGLAPPILLSTAATH